MLARPLAIAGLLCCALPQAAAALPVQRDFLASFALFSGVIPPIVFTGSGTTTVDATGDHLTSISFPANVFATQATAATGILEVRVNAANGAGTLSEGGGPQGGFGGAIPVLGTLRICMGDGGCDGTPFADVSLPLDVVGVGGTTSTPGGVFQVIGAPWSTAETTLSGTGFTSQFAGYRVGPGWLASTTALVGGFLSVVTPARVVIPTLGELRFVAVLDVYFVPEPSGLALLASGAAGLAALARRTR